MNKNIKILTVILIAVLSNVLYATVWLVPEWQEEIQLAISHPSVRDCDTISVWGYGEPPFYYREHISFKGKNIVVSNRGYVEPGYPRDSTDVIITAEGANPPHPDTQSVVRFVNGEGPDAILLGVTIRDGKGIRTPPGIRSVPENPDLQPTWYNGGGIYIADASPTISNCIIRNNSLAAPSSEVFSGGGGVAVIGPVTTPGFRGFIFCCLIDSNFAGDFGGGVYVERGNITIENSWLIANKISNDIRPNGGGGAFFYFEETSTGEMLNDYIAYNLCEGSGTIAGGICIHTPGYLFKMRKCRIVQNSCEGIYGGGIFVKACYLDSIDFGYFQNPGFNILMNNFAAGEINDLYVNRPFWSTLLMSEGNYWGSLDTDTIKSHMVVEPPAEIDFDPVAASDRVASVTYNSFCETDAIVTGDLTVNPEVTLTIVPGKTFRFDTTDDYGDDGLCELIVKGELQADGSEDQKISFTSFASSPQPGDWYGVRLEENSNTTFDNCTLKFAYCGIDAENSSTISVDSSIIKFNQVKGINIDGSQSSEIEITRSQINSNGVYGIFCNDASPSIIDNELQGNQTYGIYFNGNHDDLTVRGNQITGPLPSPVEPSLYGIVLARTTGEMVSVVNNEIEEWDQGGIYCYDGAGAQLDTNIILNNEFYGILCSDLSSPRVRWCTIDGHNTGVHCEGNSFPDLGTENDSGNNSILMDNYYWVVNANDLGRNVMAEYNWWGTDKPDGYPEKFIGPVDYKPWLREPPREEGGGQSTDIIKPTLTFALYAPKPNPAKREVRIAYSLPNRCKSELIICDAAGRIITKTTEENEPGHYEYLWHGKDQRGKIVPNGVYLIRLKTSDKLSIRKVVLSR